MLRELTSSKFAEKENRRWFADAYFDLILWFDRASKITGMQLCYDKGAQERAITWRIDTGFTHERIDDGEASPQKNLAPILVPDGLCPVRNVLARFRDAGAEIDPAIRIFVEAKIKEYSQILGDTAL